MYAAVVALFRYPLHYYTDSANVKVPVTPNLKLIMNDMNARLMNKFINQLFHVREDSFKVGKKINHYWSACSRDVSHPAAYKISTDLYNNEQSCSLHPSSRPLWLGLRVIVVEREECRVQAREA